MFSNLMGKIFGHATTSAQQATVASNLPTAVPTSAPAVDGGSPASGVPDAANPAMPTAGVPATPATATPAAPKSVDVAAILDDLASKSSEDLDWKKSIVDLLKLVGMDSSLSARKELAKDLAYSGDESDSATMNVWLHKEVLKKLAENGGKVPAELLG